MLGYFKDFINLYFLKPVYEINAIKSVDIKQLKSEWYSLNLFNDENQDNQETKYNDNLNK
jgi:hypothetical protein